MPSSTLTPANARATTLQHSFGGEGATATDWQKAASEIIERTFFRARKVLVDAGYVRLQNSRYVPTGKVAPGGDC